MTRMKVLTSFPYRGHGMQPGEEFDCEDQHVNAFVLLGKAEVVAEKSRAQKYKTRVVTAADQNSSISADA